jgi:ABC-type phosphate transport system substrate-binding protein
MRDFLATVSLLALLLGAPGQTVLAQARSGAQAYVVIINPNNPASAVDRQFLEDALLKKATRWPNGEVIRPVDLAASSPVRHAITADVLRRSVEAVKGYWQQRIFSGRDVPPPELDTDDEVVEYVLKYDGAIGYVSNGANLGGARVVPVE